MTPGPGPFEVALIVASALEQIGVVYSIGGSLAGSLAGEPRSTLDIDMVVALDDARVPVLVALLEDEFYIDEQALRRAVHERGSTNLIHQPTSFKVDLFVAGGTVLDDDLLHRRVSVRVGEDARGLWVHSPEDILLQKLRWFRRGGEISDRQWRDALGIIRTQGTRLDRDYVRAGAVRLGVADLLERALSGEG